MYPSGYAQRSFGVLRFSERPDAPFISIEDEDLWLWLYSKERQLPAGVYLQFVPEFMSKLESLTDSRPSEVKIDFQHADRPRELFSLQFKEVWKGYPPAEHLYKAKGYIFRNDCERKMTRCVAMYFVNYKYLAVVADWLAEHQELPMYSHSYHEEDYKYERAPYGRYLMRRINRRARKPWDPDIQHYWAMANAMKGVVNELIQKWKPMLTTRCMADYSSRWLDCKDQTYRSTLHDMHDMYYFLMQYPGGKTLLRKRRKLLMAHAMRILPKIERCRKRGIYGQKLNIPQADKHVSAEHQWKDHGHAVADLYHFYTGKWPVDLDSKLGEL